jgi:hypothetical protein
VQKGTHVKSAAAIWFGLFRMKALGAIARISVNYLKTQYVMFTSADRCK